MGQDDPTILNGNLSNEWKSIQEIVGQEGFLDLMDEGTKKDLESGEEGRFSTDMAYMMSIQSLFILREHMGELKESLRKHVFLPSGKQYPDLNSALARQRLQDCQTLSRFMEAWIIRRGRLDSQTPSAPQLPRLARLAERLQLKDREILAFACVLMGFAETMPSGFDLFGRSFQFTQMLRLCELTIQEAIHFLSPSRRHVKEHLISPDEDNPLSYTPVVSFSVVSVLFGVPVSQQEVLKVDKTVLAEVLIEEDNPQFDCLRISGFNVDEDRDRDGLHSLGHNSEEEEEHDEGQEDLDDETDGQDEDDDPEEEEEDPSAENQEDDAQKKKKSKKTKKTAKKSKKEGGKPPKKSVTEEEAELSTYNLNGEEEGIYDFMRDEVLADERKEPSAESDGGQSGNPLASATADAEKLSLNTLTAYTSNLEYLTDHFDWISALLRLRQYQMEQDGDVNKDGRTEQLIIHVRGQERMFKSKCDRRLAQSQGKFRPRLERLVERLRLDDFERYMLLVLVGNVLSRKVSPNGRSYGGNWDVSSFSVGQLIAVYCRDNFEQEIHCRRYFYKSSKLIREGIVHLSEGFSQELANITVELDRRMLDFIVGLDTEIGEMVEGSHLYRPSVKLDQVVLPPEQKDMILNVVSNFTAFAKARKSYGVDSVITYGAGMVLLMHGPSGTGKTMMANALANHLGKQILLINFPSLGYMQSDAVLKFVFREAKLTDSVLFLDECESMFLSRDISSGNVNLLLTEIERHPGLVLLATNRAYDMDEAMHRRITLAVEFRAPDAGMRRLIWEKMIPPAVSLDADVDLDALSFKWELTGGLIKNAVLFALCQAVARSNSSATQDSAASSSTPSAVNAPPPAVVIRMKDLADGAANQLRGRLRMQDFDHRLIPVHALEDVLVAEPTMAQLQQIVQMEKARNVLFSQWGFSEQRYRDQGTTCLFYGPPGVGKSLAAEAIGMEIGRPLKVVDLAQVTSKWVGETSKNIETIFKEARSLDLILVFDDAEGLFGARTSGDNSAVGREMSNETAMLLYHLDRFPGVVVVTTNLTDNIDPAFFRRFRFLVRFELPSVALRAKLWRHFIPKAAPLDKDVDLNALASRYDFSGAQIKTAVFKAAACAALRTTSSRCITQSDLKTAADHIADFNKDKVPAGIYT